ncbi:ABC transporter permease [Virgibacillus kekensis]|uniref:ABC transporter permease n=1 Tax=Virgibacillus kekensis TaxID=202261 RepID=A0ABV9DCX0_9BACI
MNNIIAVRFMHWKKQWISIIFWLLFPLLATLGVVIAANTIQEDAKVPVGIILEEKTDASKELVKEIKSTPFLRVKELDKEKALASLTRHELDSVFIVQEGFEKDILQNDRNQLITGYKTRLSFAYSPVKEIILSYIQQETGRSKAALFIQDFEEQYDTDTSWTFNEIIHRSKEIQKEENLLTTEFSFLGSSSKEAEEISVINVWGIWAVFCILSSLLLFDWVIKERNRKAAIRFYFTRWSMKSYLIRNFIIYTVLLFMVDLLSVSIIYLYLGEWISIMNLLLFRVLINLGAFLLAQLFKKLFLYYTVSFALTLLFTISSGAILPAEMIPDNTWLNSINPVTPLLEGQFITVWTVTIVSLAIFWTIRKDEFHA